MQMRSIHELSVARRKNFFSSSYEYSRLLFSSILCSLSLAKRLESDILEKNV